MANDNLKLWNSVEKTNPNYTKKAKVGGNSITAISPQYQIKNATEKFGAYGATWGFKNIELDYSMTNTPIIKKVQDYSTKKIEEINTVLGLVGFKATFFFPDGEFEIINSIKIFTDNKHSKIDDNYAKKVETDTLTKALSKLGFNADIFLGKFEDVKYMNELNEEFKSDEQKASEAKRDAYIAEQEKKKQQVQIAPETTTKVLPALKTTQFDAIQLSKNKIHINHFLNNFSMSGAQRKVLNGLTI